MGAAALIRPILFRDINFTAGLVMMFAVGTILVSSIALMAPWLQNTRQLSGGNGRTADGATRRRQPGHHHAVRPAGDKGRCALSRWHRADHAVLVVLGDDRLDAGRFRARTDHHHAVQGAGLGLVFTPLQVLAFATLAPSLRTEGAALFSLAATSVRRSACP